MRLFRSFTALAALAFSALLAGSLSGCSVSAPDSTTGGASIGADSYEVRDAASTEQLDPQQQGEIGVSADSPAISSAEASADRSIIQTGSLELDVSSVSDAVVEVGAVASSLEGQITSQFVSQQSSSRRTGEITIEVPAAEFSEAFIRLSQLGTVVRDERWSDDVTVQHVDLQARVEALTTSVERLSELLSQATSASDLLEIETALANRQADLDGLRAQLTALEGSIASSTIHVSVSEPSVLPGGGPQSFGDAVQSGLASLANFAASAVIVVGVLLPWLAVLAIIAAAVFVPLRIRKRRRAAATNSTDSVANPTEN